MVPKVSKSIAPAIALLCEMSTDHQAFLRRRCAALPRHTRRRWTTSTVSSPASKTTSRNRWAGAKRWTFHVAAGPTAAGPWKLCICGLSAGPRIALSAWTHVSAQHPGTAAYKHSGRSRRPFSQPPVAATATPSTTHAMPAWEPAATKEAPSAPGSEKAAVAPDATARRGRGWPRKEVRPTPRARHVADPSDADDDGANCLRCGYAIELAREKRGLMTCADCGWDARPRGGANTAIRLSVPPSLSRPAYSGTPPSA